MAFPVERMESQSSTKITMPKTQVPKRVLRSPLHSFPANVVKAWVPPEASNSDTKLPKKPHTSTSQIHRSLPITP